MWRVCFAQAAPFGKGREKGGKEREAFPFSAKCIYFFNVGLMLLDLLVELLQSSGGAAGS